MDSWIDDELAGCVFSDERLNARFLTLCKSISKSIGETLPEVCRNWASTKAAYRFLSNKNVDESKILQGHYESTKIRVTNNDGPILILHDTSEFSYKRSTPENIGFTREVKLGSKKHGIPQKHKICGILLHASLAITADGLPLGLCKAKFWTREQSSKKKWNKKHIGNLMHIPIEEKESYRWLENLKSSVDLLGNPDKLIHIGDRENDIFEYFTLAQQLGTHFLVRSRSDRVADDASISEIIATEKPKYRHKISFKDSEGNAVTTNLLIKVRRLLIHPCKAKQSKFEPIELTFLSAYEENVPSNREPIFWNLITDLKVSNKKDASKLLEWYSRRWSIETYFKILKSGFNAEKSKLRSKHRLQNIISIFCILAWRLFWLTNLAREVNSTAVKIAFTKIERKVLKKISGGIGRRCQSIRDYLTTIATLGGYLNRKKDPPPGNMVMWKGLNRLHDMTEGIEIFVGN